MLRDSNHEAREGSAGALREENAKIGFKSPSALFGAPKTRILILRASEITMKF